MTDGRPIEPRLLSREDAASYCGLSPDGFDDWRRRGLIPGPINGTRRWDRKALDLAIDKASGIKAEPGEPRGLSALEEWRRERDRQRIEASELQEEREIAMDIAKHGRSEATDRRLASLRQRQRRR